MPTVGEAVRDQLTRRRLNEKNRTTIVDVCDTCKGFTRIKRWQLMMRAKGFRFMCKSCLDESPTPIDFRAQKLFIGTRRFTSESEEM